MVTFNFKEYFVEDIIAGNKRSTIRSKMRCKLGQHMHLYTGMRTKKCRKILDTRCISIAEITIREKHIWRLGGIIGVYPIVGDSLHEQEGFKNPKEMLNFFRIAYGLPYTGFLHVWEEPPKTERSDAVGHEQEERDGI